MLSYAPLSGTSVSDVGGSPEHYISVEDLVQATDVSSRLARYGVSLTDSGSLSELLEIAFGAAIAEGLVATDTLEAVRQIRSIVAELVAASTVLTQKGILLLSVSESAILAEALTPRQMLHASAAESVQFIAALSFEGETYYGLVLNTETMARSEYLGFNFNSLTLFDGVYLGARDDGIYSLGGDTDAGTAIEAKVLTGITDFGVRENKRIPEVFMGLRSDDTVVLKVITRAASGSRVETWYEAAQSGSPVSNARVKLGKGLKAAYWQFELVNKGGADFELDTLEMSPTILSRKL